MQGNRIPHIFFRAFINKNKFIGGQNYEETIKGDVFFGCVRNGDVRRYDRGMQKAHPHLRRMGYRSGSHLRRRGNKTSYLYGSELSRQR